MKKKRKRKNSNCSPVCPDVNFECGPELSINTRMRIFGNLPWLHTCCQMIFFGSKPHYGYFERIAIGSEYQFPKHTMIGLN